MSGAIVAILGERKLKRESRGESSPDADTAEAALKGVLEFTDWLQAKGIIMSSDSSLVADMERKVAKILKP